MYRIALYLDLYSLAVFMLPNLLFTVIGSHKKGLERKATYLFWTVLFSFYCFLAIVQFAGIGTVWDWLSRGGLDFSVNLKPFDSEGTLTYILNIIMFIPLGFLLPLLWTGYRKPWKTVLSGLGLSCLIETLQLFSLRTTDIDDLLMNTLGTAVGFLLWKAFDALFLHKSYGWNGITKNDAWCLILLGTASTFFLYNWRLLY